MPDMKINIDGEIYENNVRVMHELTLGTVSTGTSPSATITNVSGSATLDLVLPIGPTGPVGPTGTLVDQISVTGSGNFISNIAVSGNTVYGLREYTFLTDISVTGTGNAVKSITQAANSPTAVAEKGYLFDTVSVTGSGNAVTSVTGSNNSLIITKGSTFLTEVTPSGVRDGLGFIPYHIEIGNTQPSGPTVWFQATAYSSNPDGTTSSTNYSSNKVV